MRTTTKDEAVKPCLMAFCAERVLPSGVLGPVDWTALARLAARRLREMGTGGPFAFSSSMRRGWTPKLPGLG